MRPEQYTIDMDQGDRQWMERKERTYNGFF